MVAAFFSGAEAVIISRGIRSLPMLKCSSERWVWAPQSLSAGTSTMPRLSVSFLISVMGTLLRAFLLEFVGAVGLSLVRYEGILCARLEHHVCAAPRLIIYETPFVALADMVLGEKDITGPHHKCFAVRRNKFQRPRQRDHELRFRVWMPIVRRVRRRLLKMDGDNVGAILLVNRAFEHMR